MSNTITNNQNFNQTKYTNQYAKDHYKKFQTNLKPDIAERINKYCTDMGISKAEFLKRAIDLIEDK